MYEGNHDRCNRQSREEIGDTDSRQIGQIEPNREDQRAAGGSHLGDHWLS